MKKMVCEICGSQSIRKENGVFICKECGTEYSLDDAKKLLQEVNPCDEQSNLQIIEETKNQRTDVDGKENLIAILYYWALNLMKVPDLKEWFDLDQNTTEESFWNSLPDIISINRPKNFPKINIDKFYVDTSTKAANSFAHSFKGVDQTNLYIARRFYHSDYLDMVLENKIKDTSEYKKTCSFLSSCQQFYLCTSGGNDIKYLDRFIATRDVFHDSLVGQLYDTYVDLSKKHMPITIFEKRSGIFGVKTIPAPLDVKTRFEKILIKSNESVNAFVQEHNKLMDYYSSKYDSVCSILGEIYDNCRALEKKLFLPIKYRNISIILDLIDLLKDGKATNWKDLINLYDTHQYRAGVYEKLDIINNKLDSIQKTLIVGFNAVIREIDNVQKQLISIDDKMAVIVNDVSKIKIDTFITMWNTL